MSSFKDLKDNNKHFLIKGAVVVALILALLTLFFVAKSEKDYHYIEVGEVFSQGSVYWAISHGNDGKLDLYRNVGDVSDYEYGVEDIFIHYESPNPYDYEFVGDDVMIYEIDGEHFIRFEDVSYDFESRGDIDFNVID